MASIKWKLEAVQDIDRLRAFLYEKDPKVARQAAQVIFHSAKRLETTPEIGRPMDDGTKRRELIIPFGAGTYVLRYVYENTNIFILRIWHSRENRK